MSHPSADQDVLDLIHHHQVIEALDATMASLDPSAPELWPPEAQTRLVQRLNEVEALHTHFRRLLKTDRLDAGLHQAVRDGWVTARDGHALWRRGLSYLQDHERPEDGCQINLLVMAVVGERGKGQQAAKALITAAQADLATWAHHRQMDLLVQAFPSPIHPLLWATLSSGQQHHLVQAMANQRWPNEAQGLIEREVLRTEQDDPHEAHVEPLIVPMVVVTRPWAPTVGHPDDAPSLTLDLLDLEQEDRLWAQFKTVTLQGAEALPPVPLTVGLTEALVDFMCMSRDLMATLHGVTPDRWHEVKPGEPIERPEGLGLPLHLHGEPVGELSLHAGWFSITEADAMEQMWGALDGSSTDAFPGMAETPEAGATSPPQRAVRYH